MVRGFFGRCVRGEGAFGGGGRLLAFGDGFERCVPRRSRLLAEGHLSRSTLLGVGRKFGRRSLGPSGIIRRLRDLILGRFLKSVVGRRNLCGFDRGFFGGRFEVFFEGKSLSTANDATITAGGRVALWTKSDSVTYFDDLRITPLP